MCTGRFSFCLKCVLTSRIVFSLNLVPLHIQQCLKHSLSVSSVAYRYFGREFNSRLSRVG